ncbi:UDP-N-acetylmuramoyl-L-alanyl-D-glutamate--2,6-diaminopimelate ligase [Alteromonas sp. a30]|uniref:UDP-N-acetylmuramoyl-L-alanyl-D-glutamate--2, 6-diaminopimelate ligase n=1 Tax=Alteromonas sp. a30 TaxID=2730917 RepID=UPI002282C329|nr:UDP-N-acetylmuramoyl-L-alanyl-D-glutamate--2,6-diaminopimelate ligase [Alteromonas sp. a30]MCY7294254.1 UDP-N-acetylmuramoyl-L-alanyl-D-glutamate--2,6-diaminopimelate ligase [Alteromonas sp. a30]
MTPKWPVRLLSDVLAPFGIDAPAIEIDDLVLDSRQVAIHKAFLAVKGHELDGRDFIPQAISLGAKVIIAECNDAAQHGETEMREMSIIIKFYELAKQLSRLAEVFFSSPSEGLKTFAVTGTNGKTSTTHFIAQFAQLLGETSALVGTLGAGLLGDLKKTQNTTPDAITMHRILAEVKADGAQSVAFEASSHALVQNRIKYLQTGVAVFTNLTRDHLDYHGDMQTYAAAKRLLLRQPGLHHLVLNIEDDEHKNWVANKPSMVNVIYFGLEQSQQPRSEEAAYCFANNIRYHASGVSFTLNTSWGDAEVTSCLLGGFNIANLLAAIASQLACGAKLATLVDSIASIRPVPGRMELFKQQQSATFVVDYAHTPDALENVLTSIKKHVSGKLWCVFGCGGERDLGKRPLMGKVAETLADQIILTSDNSRGEATLNIIKDIQKGMTLESAQSPNVHVIESRQLAVKTALEKAEINDVVVLAGKGHEDYQIIDGQKKAYDEREYLQTLLSEVKQ